MAKKMPRRLVALSSAAVAAVYVTGLVSSDAAARRALPATPGKTVLTNLPVPSTGAAAAPAAPAARSAAPAAQSAAATGATSQTGYQDGTYTGSGTSRRGGVNVSVSIKGGQIADVVITGGNTQYPLSRIASLPGEVLSFQSWQVNRVTGATYSTQAFQQAVQQALAKAGTGAAQSAGQTQPASPQQPSLPSQVQPGSQLPQGPFGRPGQAGQPGQTLPPAQSGRGTLPGQIAPPVQPLPGFARGSDDEHDDHSRERDRGALRVRF